MWSRELNFDKEMRHCSLRFSVQVPRRTDFVVLPKRRLKHLRVLLRANIKQGKHEQKNRLGGRSSTKYANPHFLGILFAFVPLRI
jgi:hypothetical protein